MILLPSVLGGLCWSGAASPGWTVEPERPQSPPPPTRYFDSDPLACKPEAIRSSYRAHLLPYADQSPVVLARLRRLQDDMTLASLKRCVQKGLLLRKEASTLFRELGLTLPGTPIPPAGAMPPGQAPQDSVQPSTRP
ncbi:hypothetical protein [Synechococcus sp. CCY 9618]|uniref:hypothetical protein n=1 Tax=Synechococcus sp. CCY 9618 TaxID=2815602 RepID=UPI001C22B761|nr:hypothetical protein [Synechococcus sp. CCY 9618]